MVRRFSRSLSAAALARAFPFAPAGAAPKKDFKVCWSIYVGWMPWGYMQEAGIMKKWADRYGLSIDVVKITDDVESINQYTAGAYDGCSMTNMDALSIPAGGGVDTTALIVGDFSNGNDAVILKNRDKLQAIKGQKVNLVELSVSHYLLARALDSVKLAEKDIKVVNTSDADMIAAYKTKDVTAVVTWNPLVSTILEDKSAKKVFDSSQIPGEIIDLMVVNTETLKGNPDFGKALVGGQGLRDRSRRLRRAARDDADVLRSEGGGRLHQEPEAAADHGLRAQVPVLARHPRPEGEERRRGRHRVRGRHGARLEGEREAALRPGRDGARGRRQALIRSGACGSSI